MCTISGRPVWSATSSATSSGTMPAVPLAVRPRRTLMPTMRSRFASHHLQAVAGGEQADVVALADHDLVGKAVDAREGDMQVGQDADGARGLDDVLAEAREIARPGAAGVDAGRHRAACGRTSSASMPSEVPAPVNMGVEVDQAGRDDAAGDTSLHDRARPASRPLSRPRRHFPSAKRHVRDAVEVPCEPGR